VEGGAFERALPNFSCRVKMLQGFNHSTLFTTADAFYNEMIIPWHTNRDLVFIEDSVITRLSVQFLI